ncbi:MAG: hypothetical protein JW726_10745 [Anaerolineales bacterium]|nr:hypothetical protein [Anaerolineales bacterium]
MESSEKRRPKRRKRSFDVVWNVITILILFSVACVGIIGILIFANPSGTMNPWPPPTEIVIPTLPFTATPTVTPRITLQPSWTPTVEQLVPTSTNTPRPSATPILTDTPVGFVPSQTPTPGGFTFVVQRGSPSAISGQGFHPDVGCNWMGVAGQATSLSGQPVIGLFVQLGGSLEGRALETMLTMTGTAIQYGQAGFEFTLADRPIPSQGTLWVQLLDQQNLPLSDKVYFDTYAECEKNLIVIYFAQVK